jgi:uncharacterized membrane protein YkoI
MEFIRKHKKRIIITFASTLTIVMVAVFASFHVASKNVNYSMEQAQDIAVSKVGGEVMISGVDNELFTTYYELTIMDENNRPLDVTVSAKTGEIVEVDYD